MNEERGKYTEFVINVKPLHDKSCNHNNYFNDNK